MSLKSWIVRREIRKAAEKAEREGGAVAKLWNWLTDPAAPGRKRGIAAVLIIVAASLRAGHAALLAACAEGLSSRLCSVESIGPLVSVLELLGAWLPTLEQGTSLAAAAMALWGLWHARAKAKSVAGLLVLGLLSGPAWAQAPFVEAPIVTTETVCKDGYVYRERCAEIEGERVCTLDPVNNLAVGAQVKGCSDMTVLGTVAMLSAAHMSDLWTTSYGLQVGESNGGTIVEANPLGQSVEQRVALKIAVITAGTLTVHLTARKNPSLARKVRAATVATLGLIAGRNMYLALKDKDNKSVTVPLAVSVSW